MRLLPTSPLGRTIFGAMVGGVAGFLMMLGLTVLCVAVCAAVATDRDVYEGPPWLVNLAGIAFWVGLIGGPLLGAIVGARRMRRESCPPGTTDGKPAQ
jgi:Putative Actinobacterial Holin-X, holin superfamily III